MTLADRTLRGGRGSVVPPAEVRTYYDRPILKRPVWTWEIPWYFAVGGLAGTSATLSAVARRTGHPELARSARRLAALGTLASPPLLISDLGRPERFHHMLRVAKPTSPMSMGTWILTVFGPAAVGAAGLGELGRLPRLARAAEGVAAALGPAMATYTAVLFADTAIPVWHEARRELPFVFIGSAAASAAGLAAALTDPRAAGPARRLAVGAAALELAAGQVMERRLGPLGAPYHDGRPARFSRWAKGLTATGAVMTGLARRRRSAAVLGGVLLAAGSVCERWAVFTAGSASADDPRATSGPQRARVDALAEAARE